jgi:Uncharacterized protein conserved in bacteria
MDFWASLEHKLRYKKNLSYDISKEISEDLLECAAISRMLDHKMEIIRHRISENK